jgi:NADPH-dependent curcumin reductase CurA
VQEYALSDGKGVMKLDLGLAPLINRASVKGFLVGDYAARNDEATRALAAYLADSKLRSREDIL